MIFVINLGYEKRYLKKKKQKLKNDLYYYLRGFPYLGSLLFWLKNVPTSICLSIDKTKGQSSKNTTLTPTKTLPKNRTTLL